MKHCFTQSPITWTKIAFFALELIYLDLNVALLRDKSSYFIPTLPLPRQRRAFISRSLPPSLDGGCAKRNKRGLQRLAGALQGVSRDTVTASSTILIDSAVEAFSRRCGDFFLDFHQLDEFFLLGHTSCGFTGETRLRCSVSCANTWSL